MRRTVFSYLYGIRSPDTNKQTGSGYPVNNMHRLVELLAVEYGIVGRWEDDIGSKF